MTWLRRLFRRRQMDAELEAEIQAHLEEKIDELMSDGLSRTEATAAARRQFGNELLIRERSREVWQWPSLESFVTDLHYAARQLLRQPGLSAVLLLTLGVGIGANATIFTWTRTVLLDPLPGAAEPERVVAVESVTPSGEWVPVSYPDFRDLRESAKGLRSMTAAYTMGLAVGEEPALRLVGELVSGDYFDVLRVQPKLGRFFSEAEREHAQNRHAVVVISHALWAERFQSDPAAIGRTLRINRQPFTVIGVAPAAFHGSMPGLDLRLWVPATMFSQLNSVGPSLLDDRKNRMFRVLGRLAPGVDLAEARAEVAALAGRLAATHPDTSQGMSANVLPLWQAHDGLQDSLRAPIGMLSGVAGVVLLIVCANTAGLLLARAADRRRELSLRHALGASRARLVRQLLTEAALLAFAGSLLGLLVAASLSGSLQWLAAATTLTVIQPRIDWGVLAFTAALAVAVTLLAGVAPALLGTRENASESLKEGGRGGSANARRQRVRGGLVAAEMALAIAVIVVAGLFLKSFRLVAGVEPGFDPQQVVLGQFNMATSGFDATQADAFGRDLRERLEQQPGVVAVSYADYVPLSIGRGSWEDLQIEGYVPGPSENMKLYRSIVAPGYFDLMKILLLEGRDFDLNDDATHAPAMIVSQEFARRFFAGQSAIGRKVHGWGRWFSVVGVVRDSKIHRLSEQPAPYFYIPLRQVYRPEFLLTFYVRTSSSTHEAIASLRRLAAESSAAPPLFNTRSLAESIDLSMFRDRIAAVLLSLLAAIAFLLAVIGLYAAMAYAVAQRQAEIGIRVALGAGRGDVVRLVLRQAALLLAVGLAAGLLGGALLGRSLAAMLFSVSPADLAVYAAATGCAVLIALSATVVPAARALRVDPIQALRCE